MMSRFFRIVACCIILSSSGWASENDILLKPPADTKGRRPLIVFLHGSGSNTEEVSTLFTRLAEAWQYYFFIPAGSNGPEKRRDGKESASQRLGSMASA